MFSITKKIAIAASLVAFCSGQLYASDPTTEREIEKPTQAVFFPINSLPEDVLKLTLVEASKGISPIHLTSVCKSWRNALFEGNFQPDSKYSALNPLMQNCIKMWRPMWAIEKFKNGVLKYKLNGGNELNIKFADLGNVFKGTFDLSGCGDRAKYLVITTDVERFFKIGGENQDKTVILIALHQRVEQEINAAATPFASIMAKWDAAKAPAGIFWRWGDDVNTHAFDYLASSSLSSISSKGLYENWISALLHCVDTHVPCGLMERCAVFMFVFGELK